jgi:hypothetical protein
MAERDKNGRFVKGNKISAQRGANKITRQTRQVVSMLLDEEFNNGEVQAALVKLRETDPAKYLDMVTKLMRFVMPTMKAVEHFGEPPVVVELPALEVEELRQLAYGSDDDQTSD